jgi:F-type H+-transporting ATPase subunit b
VTPDIQQILTQILGFLILLWLMRKFAFQPLLGMLDMRRQKIASELSAIAASQAEAEATKRGYETKLREIEVEARLAVQRAAAEGQRVAKEISDEARKEAQDILQKAKANIEQEMAKARVQLRDEVAMLAIACASRVIRAEMNPEKNRSLVLGYMDQLDGAAGAASAASTEKALG